jgi:hypothetical protein
MIQNLMQNMIESLLHYRILIAIGLPVLGGAMALASSLLMPRGMAKGLLTGAYMFMASLGAAFLCIAFAGALSGVPLTTVAPLLVPGIALTVIMGMFTPETIREYQLFEFRKLAAEIFRRS